MPFFDNMIYIQEKFQSFLFFSGKTFEESISPTQLFFEYPLSNRFISEDAIDPVFKKKKKRTIPGLIIPLENVLLRSTREPNKIWF